MMTAAALVWLSCAPSAHSPSGVVRAWSRRSASRQQQQQPEEEEEAWPQEEEGEHLGIDGLTEYLARYYGEEGEGEEGEEEAFTTEYEEEDQDAASDILFLPDLAREFTEDVRNPDLVNHLEFTRQVLHKSSHTHKSSQTQVFSTQISSTISSLRGKSYTRLLTHTSLLRHKSSHTHVFSHKSLIHTQVFSQRMMPDLAFAHRVFFPCVYTARAPSHTRPITHARALPLFAKADSSR